MNMKDGWWTSRALVRAYFECFPEGLTGQEIDSLAMEIQKEWGMRMKVCPKTKALFFANPLTLEERLKMGEEEMRRFKVDGAAKMARELLS